MTFRLSNEPEFDSAQDEIDWLRGHIGAEPADLAEAWERGYTAGGSITRRRWSDEPNAPDYPNPYIAAPTAPSAQEES